MQDIATLKAERQQLVARIAEIDALITSATSSAEYGLVERTITEFGAERTVWRIARGGEPLVPTKEFRDQTIAENVMAAIAAVPDIYSVGYEQVGRLGWKYTARRSGGRLIDHEDIHRLIEMVRQDFDAIPGRIARAAERKAKEEAERVAAQEAAERAEAEAAERAKYATPRQVDFILTLLAEREFRAFPGPGFIIDGPTERSEIEKMTKERASAYISSLKGDY